MSDRHKSHVCIFCKLEVPRIHQHFMRRHNKEAEVKEILLIKDRRKRLWAWKILKQKGDFSFNQSVGDTAGEKKIVKVPAVSSKRKRYFNCPNCLARLRTCSRAQHLSICNEFFKNTDEMTINETDLSEEYPEDLCDGMPEDIINRIRTSPHLSNFLENNFSQDDRKTLRTTASDLLRLEDGIEKITKNKHFLSHYFRVEHVDKIIKAIRLQSGEIRRDKNKLFRFPSRAQRLCRLVSKFSKYLHVTYLKRKWDIEASSINKFITLFEADSQKCIKNQATRTIKLKNINNPQVLPKTTHVKELIRYLKNETPKLMNQLKKTPNNRQWRDLAENCLCRLTIFNRRRGGAVEKLKLSDFLQRRQTIENLTEESVYNLKEEEVAFLENIKIIEILHKCDNIVKIFITKDIENAMEMLVEYRRYGNINPKNEYFFAASQKSLNPIRGVRVMERFREIFPEGIRKLLTATNLRKHGATTTQILEFTQQDSEEWAAHMGHSTDVHKKYYRQRENINTLLKTGRILYTLNEGTIKFFKGKKVSELPLKKLADDEKNVLLDSSNEVFPATTNGDVKFESSKDVKFESSKLSAEGVTERILCSFE